MDGEDDEAAADNDDDYVDVDDDNDDADDDGNVDVDDGHFMDIYDDMLQSIGFSEINESAGITKSEFRSHKFFTIFGKYFRIIIIIFGIG